jgi:hypothetical protein
LFVPWAVLKDQDTIMSRRSLAHFKQNLEG